MFPKYPNPPFRLKKQTLNINWQLEWAQIKKNVAVSSQYWNIQHLDVILEI